MKFAIGIEMIYEVDVPEIPNETEELTCDEKDLVFRTFWEKYDNGELTNQPETDEEILFWDPID